MIICICNNISDSMIRNSVKNGRHSIKELRKDYNICNKCGLCKKYILEIIKSEISKSV